MRILFVGDIVGRSGRALVYERLPNLIRDWKLDLVVANGENAAGGLAQGGGGSNRSVRISPCHRAGHHCVRLHAAQKRDQSAATDA